MFTRHPLSRRSVGLSSRIGVLLLMVLTLCGATPTRAVAVISALPGSYVALTPARLLETRLAYGGTGPVAANSSIDVQVTGRGGVPASGVGAVLVNVAAVTPKSRGYLSMYPTGAAAPNASNVNFVAGQVVPNLVLAKVGTDGKVTIRNASTGPTEVVADVAGYFLAGAVVDPGAVAAVEPVRLLDTRPSYGGSGAVAANSTTVVTVLGRGGVPATGVSAVVVNITAVSPSAPGYLTAYPTGTAVPNASTVNFAPGQVVPNLAFVKLGADGTFTIKNGSPTSTNVAVDLAGYVLGGTVTGAGMYVPLTPARVLETRYWEGGAGPVPGNGGKNLTLTGVGGIPATGVSGVVMNVAAAGSWEGFMTVYPADVATVPNASNINYVPGEFVADLVAVKTSAAGAVTLWNTSITFAEAVVDVSGYFTA